MKSTEPVKRPAFQFYPKEWIWDLNLRQCSAGARGVWADLLCLMHEGTPYGCLSAPLNLVLRVVGLTECEYSCFLEELGTHQVFSRNDSGMIYSRRMVRDEERRLLNKTNGKSGGNPRLVKASVNRANELTRITEQEDEDEEKNIRTSSEKKESRIMQQWGEFRSLYPPHRLDEEPACRAFLSRDGEADAILDGLRLAVASNEWAKSEGKYVPRASKWIFDGGFKDAAKLTPANVATVTQSTMDPETRRRIEEARK